MMASVDRSNGPNHNLTRGASSTHAIQPDSYDAEEDAGSLVDFIDDGEAEYDSNSDGLSSLSARCVYARSFRCLRIPYPTHMPDSATHRTPRTAATTARTRTKRRGGGAARPGARRGSRARSSTAAC